MDVASFAEIQQEFNARVQRIVWATVATVDSRSRPRSRILHPIWEDATGWIATGRQSFKARHIARNPYVSLSYWDQQHQQVYADCLAAWEDGLEQRRRIWELFKSTPGPYGYDPGLFWPSPEDATFGLLKLTPWRVELYGLQDLASGASQLVWRAGA
jgi:general stress protein 26